MSFFRALRSLTWRHWAWATAIPLFIAVMVPVVNFHQNWYWAHWRILANAPWYLLFGYTLLAAIAFAESSVPADSTPPAWRYACALAAAAVVYAAAQGIFPDLNFSPPHEIRAGQVVTEIPTVRAEVRKPAGRINAMLSAVNVMTYGGVAMMIYVRLRNARRAARALADAELERSRAQRDLLAAQLVAAHAKVDPEFVLRTIEDVERAYEIDVARGDVMLDEFIAYLRDAIPRLRAEPLPEMRTWA